MIYRFEVFSVDTERRALLCRGEQCHLEPQAFDLLAHLIENRDRIVTRDEILNAIANDPFASDAIISTRLSEARSAIDDSGHQQRLIKTFRRKGLRFVGLVREEQAPPLSTLKIGSTLMKFPLVATLLLISDNP